MEADVALNMADGRYLRLVSADGGKVEADVAMKMEELAHRQPVWRTAGKVEADVILKVIGHYRQPVGGWLESGS